MCSGCRGFDPRACRRCGASPRSDCAGERGAAPCANGTPPAVGVGVAGLPRPCTPCGDADAPGAGDPFAANAFDFACASGVCAGTPTLSAHAASSCAPMLAPKPACAVGLLIAPVEVRFCTVVHSFSSFGREAAGRIGAQSRPPLASMSGRWEHEPDLIARDLEKAPAQSLDRRLPLLRSSNRRAQDSPTSSPPRGAFCSPTSHATREAAHLACDLLELLDRTPDDIELVGIEALHAFDFSQRIHRTVDDARPRAGECCLR